MTQAELGQAALKVWRDCFGWVGVVGRLMMLRRVGLVKEAETCAGLAVVERVWYQEEGSNRGMLLISEGNEGAAQRLREEGFSYSSTISGHHITTVASSTKSTTTASCGYYITVLDLFFSWFRLGRNLHRLSRMSFRQSRLTNSCLLAGNL